MSNFEYQLQRRPMGVILVDGQGRVRAANTLARAVLERPDGPLLGTDLLALHPEPARAKVAWLLETARDRPDQAVGMTMTLPGVTLTARVSALDGVDGPGWCLVFHLPDHEGLAPAPVLPALTEVLVKLPVGTGAAVTLLDVGAVMVLEADGHYTRVHTEAGQSFCGLSFADLSRRLDPAAFLRVHRGFIVHLRHAGAIERADGRWHIVMAAPGRLRVPVSRGRVDLVRRRLAL